MVCITVSRDADATTGIISLPIQDIAFLEYARKIDRVIVHTIDEMYYMTGTLKYWQSALDNSGFNFVMVDRTNVVNMDKIVLLDEVHHVAYFEKDVTNTSKRCTFTNINFEKVQRKYSSVPAYN
ncbi:LytTR family DNA-binding domain-containing protein [Paenibacillus pseudetheri]|uniref:HTH LytTR-type domain-containing protein n=1 Tax=Paenibacillus pseudetheri TaxID=2897682 RepID=A0ABM9B6A6_9BACL|nr:LytTR family DNA-binding domain-containing protein [Paenibacillus pseudetheri]CAH1054047.1 hypothetical protein PAECIP111894_00192 [Paenibacillus pseudetheri]